MKIYSLIRAVITTVLLGASSIALADGLYDSTPISGTPRILGPSGQVVWQAGPGGYFVTGANGVGSTMLGALGHPTVFDYQIFNVPNFANPFTEPGPKNGGAHSTQVDVIFIAMNGSGAIAADVIDNRFTNFNASSGAVLNANGTVTYTGSGSLVTGINARGAVAYDFHSNQSGSLNYLAAGSTTPTHITDFGLTGETTGLNLSGQVTGGLSSRAFRTGADGLGTTLLGVANGVASIGLAINNAGQVGGDIFLADGSTEAFISTASGSLMVGLTPIPGDMTTLAFLNNSGQAIIQDTSTTDLTKEWWLYSGGQLISVNSLVAPGTIPYGDIVVGFNDRGDILFEDPFLLTLIDPNSLTASSLASLGGTDVTTTEGFTAVQSAQGITSTPTSFFSDPTQSSDSGFGRAGGSSVPAPQSLTLLGLGLLVTMSARRKKISA